MEIDVLKSIAITAFASQALEAETWEKMATFVSEAHIKGETFAHIKKAIDDVEVEMKAKYDTSSMPSAWRSAKSVCLSAVDNGVDLCDTAGVKGKTAVEKEVRDKRMSSTTANATVAYVQAYDKAEKLWAVLSEGERTTIHPDYRWE